MEVNDELYDTLESIATLADDEIRPYLNKHSFLDYDKDAYNILLLLNPLLDWLNWYYEKNQE